MLPVPGSQAIGPDDLILGELEHLHGLIHQSLIVALPQQPFTGTEVAEKLGGREQREKDRKSIRGVAGSHPRVSPRPCRLNNPS